MKLGIVLRCENLDACRDFYAARLGVEFRREKHSSGPEHYAAVAGGVLFELYPADSTHPSGIELMVPVSDPSRKPGSVTVTRDPDGRRVLELNPHPHDDPTRT